MKQEDLLTTLFKQQLKELIQSCLEAFVKANVLYINQEYHPVKDIMTRYDLCASSIRNYHASGFITIRRMDPNKRSRLYISVIELEKHLKENPLPRIDLVNK